MQRYTGTKTLSARPMTRGEYNAYRGWPAVQGEDVSDDGYLVEYEDGGKANDSRHAGYISWSPADVFERTYQPVSHDHRDRVRAEAADLATKVEKLATFIQSPKFDELPLVDRVSLDQQHGHMTGYLSVLQARIARFGPAAPAQRYGEFNTEDPDHAPA